MHVILTHEQADFDAIASMLGAYLLFEEAVPVLPRRMNRNVRAFLSLYGGDLPFVEPQDLHGEAIEQVTLVDTQSMVSLKGMSSETRVQVIDHHPRRENLPTDWLLTTVDVGATTTLLIEALRERNGTLTTVQATLLLLGIYEDTGSLTYARTTARDLRAAAHLIDHGASLTIAANFLNHPLSQAQQELYDRLRASVESFKIHGYTILVACGEAKEMDEELSSVVHKLRDLLDPDGLFVIVTTRSGVQLVARSMSDHINVAEALAGFGGGGHSRAAACLVRGRSLKEVHDELVDILPKVVRPAITVSQIMSRAPHLLSPEMPVDEAAQHMRLYGYEGYPVVKNGRVVGLLTRREVDRAINHKLPYTVGRLMEPGSYTVQLNDSIEHLQRLVSETGWGQVPVIDPSSGEIVGIVTRTDLLNTLAPQARIPGRLNLADRLEAALPEDRLKLIKAIAESAYQQGAALYIVGGFVRDLILEQPSLDFDLVVEGDAIALARALARRYGGRVTGHHRFGTAKWHLQDRSPETKPCSMCVEGLQTVDLVSARTEFYTHPVALPTVERGSIKLDLHRRDFTINTLALRLDGRHYGELHDYWGGLDDLRSGVVRVLHSLSFVDDPTRILRAIRFEQRFNFSIEERTMRLLLEARPLIDRLSGDRIRHELNAIFASDFASPILERLNELGLIEAIHPHLVWDTWSYEKINQLNAIEPEGYWGLRTADNRQQIKIELGYILWLMRLPHESLNQVIVRLKLPSALARVVQSASILWQDQSKLVELKASEVTARLEGFPSLSLYALYLATDEDQLRSVLWNYVEHWQKITPTIDGDYLRSIGLSPGPQYRKILTELRNAWLDGVVKSQEEEQVLLENLIDTLKMHRGKPSKA